MICFNNLKSFRGGNQCPKCRATHEMIIDGDKRTPHEIAAKATRIIAKYLFAEQATQIHFYLLSKQLKSRSFQISSSDIVVRSCMLLVHFVFRLEIVVVHGKFS